MDGVGDSFPSLRGGVASQASRVLSSLLGVGVTVGNSTWRYVRRLDAIRMGYSDRMRLRREQWNAVKKQNKRVVWAGSVVIGGGAFQRPSGGVVLMCGCCTRACIAQKSSKSQGA